MRVVCKSFAPPDTPSPTRRYRTPNPQAHIPSPCPNARAPRKNAPLRRLQPLSGAAAVQRGEQRIQGGSRGNSQSPYPSLAAGGCHKAAAAAISGARMQQQKPHGNARTQSNTPNPLPQRQSAAPERSAPPPPTPQRSGGVSRGKGESKEGLGGNRNPPNPPWPPEAATWLRQQAPAAQERRRESCKAMGERRAIHLAPCNNGRAPHNHASLAAISSIRPNTIYRALSNS